MRLRRSALILVDPDPNRPLRVVPFQYNPESLERSLQVPGGGDSSGAFAEPLRLASPPVETIRLEAELEALDHDRASDRAKAEAHGVRHQIAAFESILYPERTRLDENERRLRAGMLEILPEVAPLTLFVWGSEKVLPVRITEFSVNEEAFDVELNPVRAKVSLSMRVLSVADLGFDHPGGRVFLRHHTRLATLARVGSQTGLPDLGLSRADLGLT